MQATILRTDSKLMEVEKGRMVVVALSNRFMPLLLPKSSPKVENRRRRVLTHLWSQEAPHRHRRVPTRLDSYEVPHRYRPTPLNYIDLL